MYSHSQIQPRCRVLIKSFKGVFKSVTVSCSRTLVSASTSESERTPSTFTKQLLKSTFGIPTTTKPKTGSNNTTKSNDEVEKFNQMASDWWDPEGDFKALHSMNVLRIQLIRNGFHQNGQIDAKSIETEFPLKGLKILDIGCGGGILSQPLGRIGAQVTGLDPGEKSIAVANSNLPPELKDNVCFVHSTLENYIRENPDTQFDGVVASEVIEHVPDTKLFLQIATQLVKPSGSIFLTTLNRTTLSWMGAIVAAEYFLGIVPRGTHNWENFISPENLKAQLLANGYNTRLVHGMMYNVWNNSWYWTRCTDMNYAIHAVKDSS